MMLEKLKREIGQYIDPLHEIDAKVLALNNIKLYLHEISPFRREPVDCVLWVKTEKVVANDYNPNVMAPPVKKLLQRSLLDDGFTQPIVVSEENGLYVVVDSFNRQLLGRDKDMTVKHLNGWLPITCIIPERKDQATLIASTIRHNRARGKHQITPMSDIIKDLSRHGWTDEQISGLTDLFQEDEFSQAWTVP